MLPGQRPKGGEMADLYVTLECGEPPNTVVLTDPGPNVLEVLKVIRRRTGLSLWHGKVLIGQLPVTVLEDVPADLAEAMASELRAAGAAADVRY